MKRILLLEDDPAICEGLVEKLAREGFEARVAGDGVAALGELSARVFHLLILDLMLPKLDGLEVLRRLRRTQPLLPVLILSARGAEQQKVDGLRAGADDYLAKPFGLDELMARIGALLRRAYPDVAFEAGDLRIDGAARKAFRGGVEIPLSRKELELLMFLAGRAGRVLTRDEIARGVWGESLSADARAVDYHILNLRKKIERSPQAPRLILTHHGLGYEFSGAGGAAHSPRTRP